MKKELQRLKESHGDIKWRHKNTVRELNDVKGKNLKLKAHCSSLLKELDQRAQELQQTQKELDRAKQELDLGYSLGECMYQHLVDYYWGYFELLKYFQRPGPSSGGATITELDTNEVTTMEGNSSATSLLLHNTRSPGVIKTIWVGQNEQKNICFQSESVTWKGPYLKTELQARALT